MILTEHDEKMLSGEYGTGAEKCMTLLVKWGELFGAEMMVNVSSVHMSTNTPTEFVKEMSEGVKKTKTFCSTHAVFNPELWRTKFGVVVEEIGGGYATTDEEEFSKRINLLRELGILPTFTCSPYCIGIIPKKGDVLCWAGSSGQIISNSFFGARASRDSVSTCFAAAITGRTPLMGLLKKENRYAEILFRIEKEVDVNSFNEADYGALGYLIGEIAGSKNVAIEGLPSDIPFDYGKMLLSPLPVSGACVMCHIIGVTPEANTLEEAFGGRKVEVAMVGKKGIGEAYKKLNDADGRDVDMVVIGCPHLTIRDIRDVASLTQGTKINQNVRLVLGVSQAMYALAKECGYIDSIEMAGGMIVNSCVGPFNPFIFLKENARTVATNSTRAAHYMQRVSRGRTKTFYGDIKKCLRAAIKGKWEG